MDQPRARSSRRTSRSPTSGSTSSARPGPCWPYAGQVEDAGRGEDDLAYFRDERDFRNVHLVERDQSDFGVAMARLLPLQCLAVRALRRAALQQPTRPSPASPARRSRRSPTTSTTPASGCCGSATAPRSPTRRMQAALDAEWPYLAELFDGSWIDAALLDDGPAVDPAGLREAVLARIEPVVTEATLVVPEVDTGHSAAADAGSTPSRWATCSPRCSTSPAPTRGRHGDRRRAAAPGTSPRRCSTRSCRSSPSRTSASCAT